MKKFAIISALLLSACQPADPPNMATKQELAQLQGTVQGLTARLQQLEKNQTQVRGLIGEVAGSRMIPAGVKDALKANSDSNNPYEDGLNAYRAGNGQKAIAAFNQFLSSNPSGEEALLALYWLGDVYYNERNYSEAERYFNDFLSQAPNHPRAQNARGKLEALQREQGRSF